MKQLTRRDLLAWFGVSTSGAILFNPYRIFFEGIKNGLIQQAQAQSLGTSAKNYVLFLQYGAPPRWNWNGFIHPTNLAPDLVATPAVKNVVTSSGQSYNAISTEMEYQNGSVYGYKKGLVNKSIYMPKIWDIPLAYYSSGAGVVDANSPLMRSYLQHAMIIRGVSMGVDIGHVRGPELVAMPSPSKVSLSGAVAEMNRGKFPAIGISDGAIPYLGFKSLKQVAIAMSSGKSQKGPTYDYLEPFITTPSGALISTNKANELLMEAAMNEALAEMKDYADARKPGSAILYDTLRDSQDMFRTAQATLGDVAADFAIIRNKYKAVVARCKTAFPGLIPTPADFTTHLDLFSNGFATAEYMITKGFSTCFSFDCSHVQGIGDILDDTGAKIKIQTFNDEHGLSNRQQSAITANFTARTFMSCLHLFRQNIGEAHWNNTVVQIGSEYGRNPREDGGGSDHSPGANVTTAFSGSIKQFMPIGNIALNNPSQRLGTWGYKQSTQIEGIGTPIEITNAISVNTVGTLLGVGKIIDTATELIKPDANNGWVSKAEDPKNT